MKECGWPLAAICGKEVNSPPGPPGRSAAPLILDFSHIKPVVELEDSKFVLFKPLSVWWFVKGAMEN